MSDVLGLYAATTGGTENGLAMIDIPQDGFLVGIDWDWRAILDASESFQIELSFLATNQLATNDVRGRISSISHQAQVLTAVGVSAVSIQKWLSGFDVAMSGGERLFIHADSTAGVVAIGRCNLYIDFGGTLTRRSARRR